ncbi:hypothetical protein [Enterobacillus tribolii]|uniref:Uncharacterized protein n=1 Tax=Enterobacillus tribolii TaxID=1487935 RepID=A0A370QRS4_9GAMM|nr:hypothetical protein [Enterobacillus tribolii]MBW7983576.1 hypothetical protein [Enterobacillus tribolii]RDK91925.1 hypothetical protein C8D90_10469 [Enterobacillus tribolii]
MFTSIEQVFTSVTRVAGRRLRIALNPEAMAPEYSRYKIGFIITDMPHNAWPAPYRNLNNTGKLMLPNYAFPALPETIGEFVQRIPLEGNAATNAIEFLIPGVADEDSVSMRVCIIDPSDIEFKEAPLLAVIDLSF